MTVYFSQKINKWRAEPRFNKKRLKTRSFSTKSHALKYEREMIQKEEELLAKGSTAKDYQYKELFEIWYSDAITRKASSSLVKDLQMNRDFVSPVLGCLRVSEINTFNFSKITQIMRSIKLSNSSINKVIQHYKAVFNYAFEHDLIVKNPSKAIKQIRLPEEKMNFLEKHELKILLCSLSKKYPTEDSKRWIYIFCLCLFSTGCRLGEARALRWENISFDRDSILICCAWSNTDKSLKHYPKGRRWRTIPLNRELKKELLELRCKNNSEWVFPNAEGTRPIDDSNFRTRYWTKGFKDCDIKRITIHEARHTFASIFMMNGGNIYDLNKILDHRDMKTTERYIHFSPTHLLEARSIINLQL